MRSRRQFLGTLGMGGLALAGAPVPVLGGSTADPEHRFIFLLARGGWDPYMVFSPIFHSKQVDHPAESTTAQVGDLSFVDAESRPDVRSFFEQYADRACILNGIEVRSVAHLRCRQLILTGSSGVSDDWSSTIAANATADYLFPNVVISGPSYTRTYTRAVARVGSQNQLDELVSGDALSASDLAPLSTEASALADRFLERRLQAHQQAAPDLRSDRFAEDYLAALDDIDAFAEGDIPSFRMLWNGCGRDLATDLTMALDAMELDLCRCAMLEYRGVCGLTWDSHDSNDNQQNSHYAELFAALSSLMSELDQRTTASGAPLSEHCTVVVYSELGRHPIYNGLSGRDHWTFTSAMLLGAGVAGGRSIGALDDDIVGEPVDLATGEVSDSGTSLLPEHLGATLYRIAGLDPGDFLDEAPIEAAIAT